MADQAVEHTTIMASAQRCFDAATDFENYPQWAGGIKETSILRRDASGRAVDVYYRAASMGRSTAYTLRYFYGADPLRFAWRLQEGDLVSRLDGEYEFQPVPGGDGDGEESTDVVYHLAVELAMPLPGFVKRRAESIIVHTALDELKSYVEASAHGQAAAGGVWPSTRSQYVSDHSRLSR